MSAKVAMVSPRQVILCVDDEQIVLRSLSDQILQHFGSEFVCELAESADEALEVLADLEADNLQVLVVVSDWLMPNMRGDEFLIKVHERFPNVVKVMLTGQADQDAVERAREQANLHGYLAKPWDVSTLIETINSGLRKHD